MNDYYIKYIWGPGGQKNYRGDQTEFSEGNQHAAERFSKCTGFLLYETSGKEGDKYGAMTIFARGSVVSPKVEFLPSVPRCRDRKFPYIVKIKLDARVDPRKGVSVRAMKRIVGIGTIQRRGGLLAITKEQFDALSSELNKRLKGRR